MVLGALLLAAPTARADRDPATRAREEFLTAEAYYRKGDFTQAIVHYQRAHEAKPHPSVLYNIGECFEKLEQLDRAAEYFERYLAGAPQARDRAKVEQRIAGFRARPSRVTISSTPAGAAVTIDGVARGRTPLHVTLGPGDHTVAATARGRGAQRRRIQCTYGRAAFVAFTFGARAGRLLVRSSIEGVEVKIDGEVAGYTPYEADVAAGRHVVELTLYGYEPIRREVTVAAGASATLNERLRRLGDADTLDIRRDTQDPWGEQAPVTAPPPTAGAAAGPAAPPTPPRPPRSRARYLVGAFGGGQLAYVQQHDQPYLAGFLLGIQATNRAFDLELDALVPGPIAVDLFLRWYPTRGMVRPFLKAGLLVVWRKLDGDTPGTTTSVTSYGFGVGAGLAVDVGSIVTLFAQVSAAYLIKGDGKTGGDFRTYTLFPALAGVMLRL